jgi:hypothetical protein
MIADGTGVLERLRARIAPLRRVALLSPSQEQRATFPDARVLTEREWDLASCRPDLRFDLVIAGRVLERAPEPNAALRNVLASCRALLVMHEAPPPAGDETRNGSGAIDLSSLDGRVLADTSRPGLRARRDTLRLALVRGDLDAPLIRMDDYPTGVRPILSDMSPLHAIVRAFDQRGFPLALGIVPALLDPPMLEFLKSLRHLVPALHGYDHGYFRFAPLLRRFGDPYNERGTVGQFDEFRWHFASTVERKLSDGKHRLESELALPVTIYVPPCNRVDRRTARVLRRLGFELCLCDGAVPDGTIRWRRSDFYGRSSDFGTGTDAEVITLHVTWEWDLQRSGDTRSLPRMIDALTRESHRKRAVIQQLARDLSSAAT